MYPPPPLNSQSLDQINRIKSRKTNEKFGEVTRKKAALKNNILQKVEKFPEPPALSNLEKSQWWPLGLKTYDWLRLHKHIRNLRGVERVAPTNCPPYKILRKEGTAKKYFHLKSQYTYDSFLPRMCEIWRW